MNILQLPVEEFEIFVLVFIRVLAILVAIPVLGNRTVPTMVKAGLALTTSILIFPTLKFDGIQAPKESLTLCLAMLGEIGIGLFIGFLAQLVFAAIQVAGQFIGYQMGFGIVSVLDPQTSSQLSIIALFENLVGMLLFLSLNIHHFLLKALAHSFRLIPLFQGHYPLGLMKQAIEASGDVFVLAVKIGAPIMAVLLFVNVSMGVIARSVPQMNVFIVAFPLQIGVGLTVLGLTLPMAVQVMQSAFLNLGQDVGTLMELMRRG